MRVREKASLGTFDVVYRVKPTIYFFKVIRRGIYVVNTLFSLSNPWHMGKKLWNSAHFLLSLQMGADSI